MIRNEISCDHCGTLLRHTSGTIDVPFLGYSVEPRGDDRVVTVENAGKAETHVCGPCLEAFSRLFQTSKTVGLERNK